MLDRMGVVGVAEQFVPNPIIFHTTHRGMQVRSCTNSQKNSMASVWVDATEYTAHSPSNKTPQAVSEPWIPGRAPHTAHPPSLCIRTDPCFWRPAVSHKSHTQTECGSSEHSGPWEVDLRMQTACFLVCTIEVHGRSLEDSVKEGVDAQ